MAAADSLLALRNLSKMSAPENLDPRIRGYLDEQSRVDEMRRNIGKSGLSYGATGKLASGFASGATSADVTNAESDLASDTDLGKAARDQVRKQEDVYQTGVTYEQPEVKKMREEDAAQKMAIAAAPNEAKARGDVATEAEHNRGLMSLLDKKQAGQQAIVDRFRQAGVGGNGGNADPESIGYGRSQAPRYKMDMNASGDPVVHEIPITNQTAQMGESANGLLDFMDQNTPSLVDQATNLKNKGLFSPGIGTVRQYLAQHGMTTLAGVDDQTASQIGQFETQRSLLLKGVARALAGARGAGNSSLAASFEKLASAEGDLPTYIGQLNALRQDLEIAAAQTNPSRKRGRSIALPGAGSDDLGVGF